MPCAGRVRAGPSCLSTGGLRPAPCSLSIDQSWIPVCAEGKSVGRGFASRLLCSAGLSVLLRSAPGRRCASADGSPGRREICHTFALSSSPSRARLEFGTLVTVDSLRHVCDGLRLTRTSLISVRVRRSNRWTLRLRPRRIAAPRETSTRRSPGTAGRGHRGRRECPLRGTRTRCRELFG